MKSMTRQEFVAHLRRLVLAILPTVYHPCVFSLMTSCISEIVTDRRRSSGFSRGASIYRGVTRFVCGRICRHILLPCSTKVHIETTLPHWYVHVDYITGITSMEDGSLGLAGLLETRICTSALSVRKISI